MITTEAERYRGSHGWMCSRGLHRAKPERYADVCDCGIEAWGERIEAEAVAAERARITEAVRGLSAYEETFEYDDAAGSTSIYDPMAVYRAAVLAIVNPEADHD